MKRGKPAARTREPCRRQSVMKFEVIDDVLAKDHVGAIPEKGTNGT